MSKKSSERVETEAGRTTFPGKIKNHFLTKQEPLEVTWTRVLSSDWGQRENRTVWIQKIKISLSFRWFLDDFPFE